MSPQACEVPAAQLDHRLLRRTLQVQNLAAKHQRAVFKLIDKLSRESRLQAGEMSHPNVSLRRDIMFVRRDTCRKPIVSPETALTTPAQILPYGGYGSSASRPPARHALVRDLPLQRAEIPPAARHSSAMRSSATPSPKRSSAITESRLRCRDDAKQPQPPRASRSRWRSVRVHAVFREPTGRSHQ